MHQALTPEAIVAPYGNRRPGSRAWRWRRHRRRLGDGRQRVHKEAATHLAVSPRPALRCRDWRAGPKVVVYPTVGGSGQVIANTGCLGASARYSASLDDKVTSKYGRTMGALAR